MKIGFDAKRAFSNFTGLGNYSRSTLKNLTEYFPEHEYFLYNPRVPDEHQIQFLDLPHHAKVHIKIPQTFFFEVFSSAWRRYGISSDIVRDDIDLYHGLSHEIPANIHKTGIKSVVTIHDLIFKVFPEYYKIADRKIYDQKFRHACETADGIIAISECTRQDVIRYYNIDPKKIRVIYQGCSEIFERVVGDKEKSALREKYALPSQYLLSVGSIERRKNALLILQALKELPSDLHVVLVGKETEYCKELRAYISENSLQGRVHFLHRVSFEDLPGIYQLSKVFVYPSRYEGFGIPILEALHSGVPVVAAKGSCLEEAGGARSVYIDPDNFAELKNALLEILNKEDVSDVIAANKKHAEEFNARKIAQEIMDYYQEILEQ